MRTSRGVLRRIWWVFLWEPRDLWIGVYWDRPRGTGWSRALDVYVCVLPCFPLRIEIRWMDPDPTVQAG